MRRAQTSMEYLLLTAGVLLVGVIASQTVLQSSTATNKAIQTELNTHVVPKDVTPPTTDLICNGGVCYSRYNTDVKIGFSCVDNVGGVGCAKTYYDVTRNGSAYKSGSCDQAAGKCANVLTLTAPPAGNAYTYVIKFYSEDLNGNKEGEKSVTIKIGKASTTSALLSTCKIDHSPKWPKPGDLVDVNVSLASGDAVHNATVAFTTPAGTQTAPCGDITKVTTCSHPFSAPSSPSAYTVSVEVNGEDSFGNKGSCGSASFVVDGLAPNVSITAPDPCKWYRTDFTVHVSASDPNPSSLLHRWEYKVADGVPPEYTSGIKTFSPVQSTSKSFVVTVGKGKFCSVEGKKTCDVSAYFTDRAGNTGSKNEQYSIDYTPPTLTLKLPAEGWVNQPINVGLHCEDNPSNGSGCKAIYWAFVDPNASCPTPGSSAWQKKTFSPTGCPEQYPMQADATATLDCQLCTKDICYYAEDGAGNITSVERSSLGNPNGNPSDGSYAIDKDPPSCQISLSSEPTVVNGSAPGTDWRMGGIGGYSFDIICSDQSDGSGLAKVRIEIANPNCGGCQLSCSMESDVRTLGEWATGGGLTSSTATSAEFAISPSPYGTAFHCTIDATPGSVCTASGITVTATDWAGNSATSSGSANIKLDAKPPVPTQSLVSTDPQSPVCGSWYKTFTITTTGTEEGATSCNSGLYEYIAQVTNGDASPSSKNFNFTANETIPQVVVSTQNEGAVCIVSDYHDTVANANWTDPMCYNLDGKPPSVSVYTDRDTYYVGDTINVTATASDGGSGLKSISIVDSGYKIYPCGTASATLEGSISATCQDAGSGQTTVVATATDQIGNSNSATKTVSVFCRNNSDCSCFDAVTCSGSEEIDWAGICNRTCSQKRVGSFDCSNMTCQDITECVCDDTGNCKETTYKYTPQCVPGTGCTCVLSSSSSKSVPTCPT